MPKNKPRETKKGRPKGTTRGRKKTKSITFENDLLAWVDAIPGHRSTAINDILRSAKEISDRVNVTKY